MKFETSCLDISFDKVLDDEFEILIGFRKARNAFYRIGPSFISGFENGLL